ncbi:RING-H2 finger protein ATL7 isoform X1 [Rhodamnia argentea]|uniref:RING-type E3 ubiquitin transferase n=1 Tax=Rhodamnia argentea TaxID=178133 RepID=A0A8B8QWM6_9MYRT|nr:RING-H2 finger protein ATL7 isoform X1 [Rhodamnia argentea]
MSSETETSSSSDPPPERCCSSSPGSSLTELKLYQAFIFSVPIVFTFVLLFSFYLFYLRRRRADWVSLRMRASRPIDGQNVDVPRPEVGLRKELREMLPVIVYKESFSVNDSQCSVCLGDYEAEDRLQQVPACGHTFHMGCIDHWLATHTTCPLCRVSLLAPTNRSVEVQTEAGCGSSDQDVLQVCEETDTTQSQQENGVLNEETDFQLIVLETEQHP